MVYESILPSLEVLANRVDVDVTLDLICVAASDCLTFSYFAYVLETVLWKVRTVIVSVLGISENLLLLVNHSSGGLNATPSLTLPKEAVTNLTTGCVTVSESFEMDLIMLSVEGTTTVSVRFVVLIVDTATDNNIGCVTAG